MKKTTIDLLDKKKDNIITVKGSVLVVGGGIGGIQAAMDLADSGFYVHLIEKSSAIGGIMPHLDKTFPTNDCSMCILSPKLVECGRHPNVKIWTLSELKSLKGEAGNFRAEIIQRPRFVDLEKCTGCGDCTEVCPVRRPGGKEKLSSDGRAIYRKYPQAYPGAFVIEKKERAPCIASCPAGINVQGYIALLSEGMVKEALTLIYEEVPLPGVLGRICPHPCEDNCHRGKIDDPIGICSLKRFAADYSEFSMGSITPHQDAVAIVGSGPAGLSAAYHLARKGCRVTIYESLSVPGGMLAAGIPEFRLPRNILENEINVIRNMGVQILVNTPVESNGTGIEDLLEEGYGAVLLATGAHKSRKLNIKGENLEGVIEGTDFLREHNISGSVNLHGTVAVIGGGDVAVDAARTAVRIGADRVTIFYRRSSEEMPARKNEIEAAISEGVNIEFLTAPQLIEGENNRVKKVLFQRMRLAEPDESHRRRPVPVEGSDFTQEIQFVISAIGQEPDLSYISPDSDIEKTSRGLLQTAPGSYKTNYPGIFAAGDVVTGPWTAIHAIAAGKEAAESIMNYFDGKELECVPSGNADRVSSEYSEKSNIQKAARVPVKEISPEIRITGFDEIESGYNPGEAVEEAGRCLQCGVCSECMECIKACKADAIIHDQTEIHMELEIGSVILAPGFQPFNPEQLSNYGYGQYPNVVTSIELENILNASGPTNGKLKRITDDKPPEKIAWIQCVGSRDVNSPSMPYCSSFCCMAAIKEAVISKEHSDIPLDAAIFFMDIRAHGKDFERYALRAERDHGIRFIRSKIHSLMPSNNVEGSLILRYADENDQIHNEDYDMVVLSVGARIPEETRELAGIMNIETDEFGFAGKNRFNPVSTSKKGIFVCGNFREPADIPETVMTASAAASAAGSILAPARNTLTQSAVYPPERKTQLEPVRTGVFVCHCGVNIGGTVNVTSIRDKVKDLPGVVFSTDNLYTCSNDTQIHIRSIIDEYQLNRIVVASCTPRTHESLFKETLKQCGLNPALFEMANIRDQCSWVHMDQPVAATQKAWDLVRMAVAKVYNTIPAPKQKIAVKQTALVIGGGVAGISAALQIADQGFETHLVEKTGRLGGFAAQIPPLNSNTELQTFVSTQIDKISNHPHCFIHLNTRVVEAGGYVGNFVTGVSENGTDQNDSRIEHGVVIIATGANEYQPDEYGYEKNDKIITSMELKQRIGSKSLPETHSTIVMIQCVGSRTEDYPVCSRICCTGAVENAIHIKELTPETDVIVLYRDIRTYGLNESLYTEAKRRGVKFIRFDSDQRPVLGKDSDKLRISVDDSILGKKIVIEADLIVLSTGMQPSEQNKELSRLYKVPLNEDGFFLEAHMKLRPVDFATDGVFICGSAHSPKFIPESIVQAQASAARALRFLTKKELEIESNHSQVQEDLCKGCGTCESLCPFSAIQVDENKNAAVVTAAICKACGACVAGCRSGAISLPGCSDEDVFMMLETLNE